jgi:leucyl/phenylalanyl-tRNA--protein transferase
MRLTPNLLLNAYSQGIFPMAHDDGTINFYDPDPRAIIPLDAFHIPRSLARRLKRDDFEIQVDRDFRAVMEACAAPAPGRETTWISPELIEVYCELHILGFALSVEVWLEETLAGGLYGVTLGGLFAGESMFSRVPDTSKIALVYLVNHLRRKNFCLLDTQFITPHLQRFGAIEISRREYKRRLDKALRVWAKF